MNKKLLKSWLLAGVATFAILSPIQANAGDDLKRALINDGDTFGEVRYRYEGVDQTGIPKDADASTIRTNIGYKTGIFYDFQALVEAQFVKNIGAENFNDTNNRKTNYPVVADPDNNEINQAWLSWTGLPDTTIKVGREAINLGNQRFIGSVGWRQNDQTFDNVHVINSSIPDLTLLYGYVWNVNRIFGDDHPLGDLNTNTHLINATYNVADWMNITGYGYLYDIARARALSSQTYGVRLTGDTAISDTWNFFYEVEMAKQSDYSDNTADFSENYYHVSPGIKGHGFTFQAGYEELGGNGTNSFQTPLATLHKFNGWVDKFLGTPATGLEDAYAKVSYKVSGVNEWVDNTNLTAIYHEFDGDSSGDFGSELDLSIGKNFKLPESIKPFNNVNVLLKYSDYNADDAPFTDTQKLWFQAGVKF